MQRITQRLRGHHAQKALAGVEHIGVVAVGVLQQAQRGAAATVAVLGNHRQRLAGNVGGLEHGSRVHALNKGAHIFVGGVAQNVVGCAHLLHHAVLHDGDAVANAHGFVQIVRDEDDGAALDLLQAQQLGLHFGADDGVQRREGLVHQQDGRVRCQRTGQAHALLHAAREFVGVAGAPGAQAHLLQRILRLLLAGGTVHTGQFQAKGRVVQHRQVRHQRKRLKHHRNVFAAQGAQFLVAEGVDVFTIHQNAARRGFDQTVEHAHQRGFARARQAHDDKDFTGFDGEVGVEHADGLAGAGQDFLLVQALLDKAERGFRVVAEDLEDVIDSDLLGHCGVLLLDEMEHSPSPTSGTGRGRWRASQNESSDAAAQPVC